MISRFLYRGFNIIIKLLSAPYQHAVSLSQSNKSLLLLLFPLYWVAYGTCLFSLGPQKSNSYHLSLENRTTMSDQTTRYESTGEPQLPCRVLEMTVTGSPSIVRPKVPQEVRGDTYEPPPPLLTHGTPVRGENARNTHKLTTDLQVRSREQGAYSRSARILGHFIQSERVLKPLRQMETLGQGL